MQPNVMFINGWGNALTSTALAGMRQNIVAWFGRNIYCPPPVNYTETGLILRYLEKTKDPWIIAALSCGCSTINLIATARPSEPILYAMYCSPSMWCGVGTVPSNIRKATQVSSRGSDPFNPGTRRLVVPAPRNVTTVIDEIKTGLSHGYTPSAASAQARLNSEISLAMKGMV